MSFVVPSRIHLVVGAFAATLCLPFAEAQTPPKVKSINPPRQILFIGNSLTYYNGSLHAHLRGLIDAGDPENRERYYLRAATISIANLSEHTSAVPWLLSSRKWDVVVFQGANTEPIDKERMQGFRAAALHFSNIARVAGTTPAIFMTWGLQDKPEMIPLLRESITTVGNEAEAFVVPVGLAFEKAHSQRPALALFVEDKIHPTIAGTYLSACVFYASFFGKSPVGLAYRAGLSLEDTGFLQAAAWETVQGFYGPKEIVPK